MFGINDCVVMSYHVAKTGGILYGKIFYRTLLILFVSCLSYYYVIGRSANYGLSDAYYYSSIAESVFQGHGFYDITFEPKQPVVTPQNAIVFIHMGLMACGLESPGDRFIVLNAINYVCFFLFLWICFKILDKTVGSSRLSAAIVASIVLSLHFYIFFLQPINDGIFTLLAMNAVYLILTINENYWRNVLCLFLVAILIMHFRLQGLLIFGTAAVCSLINRNLKSAVIFLLMCVIAVSSIMILSSVLNINSIGINSVSQQIIQNYTLNDFVQGVVGVFANGFPGLFWGAGTQLEWAGLLFFLVMVVIVVRMIQKGLYKDLNIQFLFLYSAFVIGFVLFFNYFSPRLFATILIPLWVIVIKSVNDIKISGMIIGINIFIIMCILLYRFFFWDINYDLNLQNSKQFLAQDYGNYDLVSQDHRKMYFFMGKRSLKSLAQIKNGKTLLVGTEEFVAKKIDIIKRFKHVDEIVLLPYEWKSTKGDIFSTYLIMASSE